MRAVGVEFKVGVFTLIAATALGYMFFVLSPDAFDKSEVNKYYTIVPNAAGVIPKTQVKTNGVVVGKVQTVELEANRTRISFEVFAHVKVPEGSKIELRTRGLLGDVFVEIIRGEDANKLIQDGGFVPMSEDAVDLQALVQLFGNIAKDVKRVTNSVAAVLGTPDGEKDIAAIVQNIKGLTGSLREVLDDNKGDVRSIVQNIKSTTNTLRTAIGERESDVHKIVDNIKFTTGDLRHFAKDLRELLNDSNKQRIDRILAHFDESMVDVKGATKNIRLIAEKVEKGEGTLGRLVNDDKTLSEFEAAIKDIRKVLAPATRLQVGVDYHGEYRRDESTQNYFNIVLTTRPDKQFILGLTDKKERVVDNVTEIEPTATDPNGIQSVRKTEHIKEETRLRFNIQFAKRWYWAALRFGLFESSGGVASDFYLFNDRVRASIEAFDWDSESTIRKTAHLKGVVSYSFFKHVYLLTGIDDPTRYEARTTRQNKDLNYFFGAGLSFDDDDLKAVLGTAALAR